MYQLTDCEKPTIRLLHFKIHYTTKAVSMSPILKQQKDSDDNVPYFDPGDSTNNELKPPMPSEGTNQDLADDTIYPTGIKLILIFMCLICSTFLVALDATILATAIPTITSDLKSLTDVAWYNSAFLLTTCAFQLPYGRAYTLFSTKWVFFSAIVVFELGSVICATAPNSVALIIGRAIAGKNCSSYPPASDL